MKGRSLRERREWQAVEVGLGDVGAARTRVEVDPIVRDCTLLHAAERHKKVRQRHLETWRQPRRGDLHTGPMRRGISPDVDSQPDATVTSPPVTASGAINVA